MAYAGALPKIFDAIGKTHRTLWPTIILVGLFASIFAAALKEVAEFTNFVVLLVFAGVNASAIQQVSRSATDKKPGRVRPLTNVDVYIMFAT